MAKTKSDPQPRPLKKYLTIAYAGFLLMMMRARADFRIFC
jgi:hypothetical protein